MRIVFCSAPVESAKSLATKMLEARLVACVQILPPMRSLYWWDGKICDDQESLLLLKTPEDKVLALKEALISSHPYDLPEVLTVEVREGESHGDYLEWARAQTRG